MNDEYTYPTEEQLAEYDKLMAETDAEVTLSWVETQLARLAPKMKTKGF